jgi:hypothetical protein
MVPVHGCPPSRIILSPSLVPGGSSAHHRGDERLLWCGPYRFRKCGADATGFTQVLYRRSGGRRGEGRYLALDRGHLTYTGSQGHHRGGVERPADGELHGHEVRSGPRFLFLETLTQRGSGALVATNTLWQVPRLRSPYPRRRGPSTQMAHAWLSADQTRTDQLPPKVLRRATPRTPVSASFRPRLPSSVRGRRVFESSRSLSVDGLSPN